MTQKNTDKQESTIPHKQPNSEALHAALTEKAIGVIYSVYNELGHGFLESVYEEAMSIALQASGLRVERQVHLPVWFRGRQVGEFKADMIVEGAVLLELKAVRTLEPSHEAQTLHYLRSTNVEVALLLNFGPRPQIKRLVFDNARKRPLPQSLQSGS